MKDNFEKAKRFCLKNIEIAGERSHASQRNYLRELYKQVNNSKSIQDIFDSIESIYNITPCEKSLIENWPNQKYFIQWLDHELAGFLMDLENGTNFASYYTGYPYGAGDMGGEWEEQQIEKALVYT